MPLKIRIIGLHGLIAITALFFVFGLTEIFHAAVAAQDFGYQAVKTAGDSTVYLLSPSLYKMPVPSMLALKSYGVTADKIQVVPQNFLDLYSSPRYMAQVGSANIYLFENGQRRYLNEGFKKVIGPKGIFLVSAVHLKSVSLGKPVNLAEAQILAREQVAAAVSDPSTVPQCNPDPSVGGEDGCIIYEAIRNKNPQECYAVKDPKWQLTCWLSFEAPQNDPLLYCRNVPSNFLDNCISNVAVKIKNNSLCNQITASILKTECQANVGVVNGDLAGCNKLPAYSSNQTVESKDACLYAYALLKGKPEACAQIDQKSPYYNSCGELAEQLNKIWENN